MDTALSVHQVACPGPPIPTVVAPGRPATTEVLCLQRWKESPPLNHSSIAGEKEEDRLDYPAIELRSTQMSTCFPQWAGGLCYRGTATGCFAFPK